MSPIIFISHRTQDATVAEMLRDYLVATGISNEFIFCSSLPGNDVKSAIPREVKEKIAYSTVNIVILSHGYYESAYCLNEAGIIWLQEPQTPAIVVGLPEISPDNMLGFLNNNYILRRLDDANDLSAIYDTVRDAVGATQVSLSVATAASQTLIRRYTEYLKAEAVPAAPTIQPIISTVILSDITTDDERVVLYYILEKKVRCIKKPDVLDWINKNEVHNINVENALDLLASRGKGTYENEKLSMDVEVFSKYTAKSEETISLLKPTVEKYQKLSSKRFVDLWEAGIFSNEDKLFIAYIIQNNVTALGARWMAEREKNYIQQWVSNNCLDSSIASKYYEHLQQFIDYQLVYEIDWTNYKNARAYTLYPSLKSLLFGKDFPYTHELEIVVDEYKKLPF